MNTRRELVALALGVVAAPGLAEAAEKKPRFEEYVTKSLTDIGSSISDQTTTLEDVKDALDALVSELDKVDNLLGNTRLLDALHSALTELTASCKG